MSARRRPERRWRLTAASDEPEQRAAIAAPARKSTAIRAAFARRINFLSWSTSQLEDPPWSLSEAHPFGGFPLDSLGLASWLCRGGLSLESFQTRRFPEVAKGLRRRDVLHPGRQSLCGGAASYDLRG